MRKSKSQRNHTYFRPEFGSSVDIFENTFVVGAPRQVYGDLSATRDVMFRPPKLQGTGAAYMFTANVTLADLTGAGRCSGTTTGKCNLGADAGDGTPWCESIHGCYYINGFCLGTATDCKTTTLDASHSLCNAQPGCAFIPTTDFKYGEHSRLTASDAKRLDNFGSDVALDGDVLAVAAFSSSSDPTCTWDFEAGNLRGWQRSGTAFNNQPTFGDNPMFRNVYVKNFVRTFSSRKIYDIEEIQGDLAPFSESAPFRKLCWIQDSFHRKLF